MEAGCYCCKNTSHLFKDCPFIHYAPNLDFIIRKNNFSKPNDRSSEPIRKNGYFSHVNCLKLKPALLYIHHKHEKERKELNLLFNNKIQANNTQNSLNDESLGNEEESSSEFDENQGTNLTEKKDDRLEPKISNDLNYITSNSFKEETNELLQPPTSPTLFYLKNRKIQGAFNKDSKENKESFVENKEKFPSEKFDNYEPNFIQKLLEFKRLILQEEKISIDHLGNNLFDFTFEKSKDFQKFFRDSNLNSSLKKFQRYLKICERKMKKHKSFPKKDKYVDDSIMNDK